ncbi:MAG: ThuA domain-containing protein [Balneolaceae bacterium]
MHRCIDRFAILLLISGVWLAAVPAGVTGQSAVPVPETLAEIAVYAGEYDRLNTPVTASLQGVRLSQDGIHALQLVEVTAGLERPVSSQVQPGLPGTLSWILDDETGRGEVRNYELRLTPPDGSVQPAQIVDLEDNGEELLITFDGKPVLNYRYSVMEVPDGVDEIYTRGGYIHPIWSPGGEILSRIQPPDHYHHYGIWNPWTQTEFEGRVVDFWNLAKGEGTVRSEHIPERTSGDVFGGFKALHDHVDFTGPAGEKVALNEEWDVDVWNVRAEAGQEIWLIDFVSTLSPATSEPFTILEYRYQGFSLRATERWNDENADLLTSEGYDKSNANATRARWIDVNGISDVPEGRSGILFMTHPENYNFPEQLRIWPVGTNGGVENVYINFNPAQDRDFILQPGKSYTLKHRMLVYDGRITPEVADRIWSDYASPPAVEVQPVDALSGARVLVYTRNGEGYVHDNLSYSVMAIEKLGEENGFRVDVSNNPSHFTLENLSRYDALIFSNTNNDIFETAAQREALQEYIQNGGGFLGIHSASGSERSWPWFSQLLGGNFVRHAPQQDFTVNVLDQSHPSTSFLPDRWEIESDECYFMDELNPRIRVLLSADLSTVSDEGRDEFPGTLFGEEFPLAWYQTFDGGRQWYTSLGHRPEQYEDPLFLRHILGGLRWVVSGSP